MTHYRLTLTRGRKPVKILAERHAYGAPTPRFPSGWWTSIKTGASAHVRVCWMPDEECEALRGPEPPHTPTPSPKSNDEASGGTHA